MHLLHVYEPLGPSETSQADPGVPAALPPEEPVTAGGLGTGLGGEQ